MRHHDAAVIGFPSLTSSTSMKQGRAPDALSKLSQCANRDGTSVTNAV